MFRKHSVASRATSAPTSESRSCFPKSRYERCFVLVSHCLNSTRMRTCCHHPACPWQLEDLWILGLYDPETSNNSPAVSGLGSTGISVVNSHVRVDVPRSWIVVCGRASKNTSKRKMFQDATTAVSNKVRGRWYPGASPMLLAWGLQPTGSMMPREAKKP